MPSQPKVMVVEDQEHLRRIFASHLEGSYDVVTVGSGEEALDRLAPDIEVVLLDRRLPGKDGEEVLQQIRERGEFRVAMVTAVAPDFDIIEMAFDDYLTKPVFGEDLHAVVEHLLDLRSYDRTLKEYLSLVRKRSLLLEEKRETELLESDEFQALEDELAERRRELDRLRDTLDVDDDPALFEQPTTVAAD